MSTTWQDRLIERDPSLHVYLIGIGGAGLSAIAVILHQMGVRVSGSDRQSSATTSWLADMGIPVQTPQHRENIEAMAHNPDVVLISSAIDADNPERVFAEEAGIPTVKRSTFLPAMLKEKKLIAVAGTHGKSTTTAMIVKMLREAGIQAGYLIGATLPGFGNASAGDSRCPYFVIEADEYDYMFLGLHPTVAVITNVEWDHPDCFPTEANFRAAFVRFAHQVVDDGLVITCADDPGAEEVRLTYQGRANWVRYGLNLSADVRIERPVASEESGYCAELFWWNAPAGQIALEIPGMHNLQNALAAIYVGRWCGVPIGRSLASLRSFRGASRRFERKGEIYGITVFDDYAHHPTEVRAVLTAASACYPGRRIWAVFQPHTFSRTEQFFEQISRSFNEADRVLVTDIYAARESAEGRISAADLVSAMPHPAVLHTPTISDAVDVLAAEVSPRDVVITMGAGDSHRIGEILLGRLAQQEPLVL